MSYIQLWLDVLYISQEKRYLQNMVFTEQREEDGGAHYK